MLHPVGSLPPHVYWRRRVMLGGALAATVLLVLTIFALSSNGTPEDSAAHIAAPPSPTPSASATRPATSSSSASSGSTPSSSTSTLSTSPAGSSGATVAPTGGSAAAPPPCIGAQLTISAASQAPTYHVGDQPVLILQVTNNGPGNCTQDLADPQVELRVYNGAARVWGSHDCLIQPGTEVKTLVAGTTVGVQITWSGLSSQPACAGTRQRVGAGTYTLYPYLAGAQGTAAQFTIS